MSVGKRILKDGSVRWYIQYFVNGKRITETVPALTEKQARKIEQKRLAQIEIEEKSPCNRNYEVKITFREWSKRYLQIKEAQGRRTLADIRYEVATAVDYFGDIPLARITKADCDTFVAWRRKQRSRCGNKPVKEATVNRCLAQLKNLFEEAVRNGIIRANPAKYTEFLEENNVRKRVLTPDEYNRLLANSPRHLRSVILVAYHTGMRRGEILKLTWDRVDMAKRMIILEPPNTKTNKKRLVPMNEIVFEVFSELYKTRSLEHEYVFTYKGAPVHDMNSAFRTACKKARITDFRFHDLRHCFNTNARKAGIHDHVIMAITGHKTMEMFTRYDTVDEEDITEAIQKLEKKCSVTAARKNENDNVPCK